MIVILGQVFRQVVRDADEVLEPLVERGGFP